MSEEELSPMDNMMQSSEISPAKAKGKGKGGSGTLQLQRAATTGSAATGGGGVHDRITQSRICEVPHCHRGADDQNREVGTIRRPLENRVPAREIVRRSEWVSGRRWVQRPVHSSIVRGALQ